MTIFILTLIYILSFWRMYFWIKNAYSKGGVLYNSEPDISDVFLTIIPVFNTVLSVIATLISVTGKREKEKNYSNFFNIKK